MSALDLGARQLAVRAGAQARRADLLSRLARGITRGGLAPLSSSPPIIGAPAEASVFPAGTEYSAVTQPGRYTFLRAEWAPGTGFPLDEVMIARAVNGTPGPDENGGSAPLVRFWSDAPLLEIVNCSYRGGYRLRVDGEYVATGFIARQTTTSFRAHTSIDWSGVRRARLYEVEGEANTDFFGVRLPPTATVWAAPLTDDGLRIVVHGDSFVEGAGASPTSLYGGLANCMAQLLGQPDTRGSGQGGTGYLSTLGGQLHNFIQRVDADVIAPAPQVVIEMGGCNDRDLVQTNATAMQAVVTTWLDRVQAALPDTLIFVTGPMSPNGNLNSESYNVAVRDGKKAACLGRRNVVFIDNLAQAWVTGTGRVGSTTGDGIADWVTSNDGTHPSDDGHRYLAERVVRAIAGRLGDL
jgi:lysophospholipase L1-like esterase